jgi:hypothetical protein
MTALEPRFTPWNTLKYFAWAERDPSWRGIRLTPRGRWLINAARIFALFAYLAIVGKVETL